MGIIRTDTKHTGARRGAYPGMVSAILRTQKGKHHAMTKKDLPLSFLYALTQDKRAMRNFAGLSDKERDAVLSRAQAATSRADMQLIAQSLSDEMGCVEHH